jgi:hypothetical protein
MNPALFFAQQTQHMSAFDGEWAPDGTFRDQLSYVANSIKGLSMDSKWVGVAMDSYLLSLEASCVMWLRWQRLLLGGAVAERESRRMVTEKVVAGMALVPALAASGALGSAEAVANGTLAHYGKAVRSNRRRLTR